MIETLTTQTSTVAGRIASDKAVSLELVGALGVPVPLHYRSQNRDQVAQAVEALGFPLAVKPASMSKGRGVAPLVANQQELEQALKRIDDVGAREILIEEHVPGDDHRILVVGGRFVACALRIPASVVGDGTRTVRALADEANSDPRRGRGFEKVMVELTIDDQALEVLAAQGLTPETVLPAGRSARLRLTANISTGGSALDVTDRVHPEVIEMAELAATISGVDIAGIDYVATDISKPPDDVGGAMIEINCGPGLRPHWAADGGRRDLLGPILDTLFPGGQNGRIPIAAITGSVGKTTTCRLVQQMLIEHGLTVGMTCTDGIYVQQRCIRSGDRAGGRSSQQLLNHPGIDAAILETARGGLIRGGIGYGECDVAAVINVDDEHIGDEDVPDLETMAALKSIVVRTARKAVVLNADDALCMGMRASVGAGVQLILFGRNPDVPALREQITYCGTVVTAARTEGQEHIVIVGDGGEPTRVIAHTEVRALGGGALAHNLKNVLAATAVAHAMGVDRRAIRSALRAFASDWRSNPGRLSLFGDLPFKVLLDLPVNDTAMSALCRAANEWSEHGPRVLAMTVAGNRRNAHFEAMAAIAAADFDRFVLFTYDDPRGRGPAEVPEILAAELRRRGIADDRIEVVPDQAEACARALALGEPGGIVALHCIDCGPRRDALVSLIERGAPFSAVVYRRELDDAADDPAPG